MKENSHPQGDCPPRFQFLQCLCSSVLNTYRRIFVQPPGIFSVPPPRSSFLWSCRPCKPPALLVSLADWSRCHQADTFVGSSSLFTFPEASAVVILYVWQLLLNCSLTYTLGRPEIFLASGEFILGYAWLWKVQKKQASTSGFCQSLVGSIDLETLKWDLKTEYRFQAQVASWCPLLTHSSTKQVPC